MIIGHWEVYHSLCPNATHRYVFFHEEYTAFQPQLCYTYLMRNRPRTKQPHLLIAIPTKGSDGQNRVDGVIRYMNEHSPWRMDFLTDRIEIEALLTRPADLARYDGVIAAFNDDLSVDYRAVRDALRDTPLVIANECLLPSFPPEGLHRAVFVDNALIGAEAARYFTALGRFATFAFYHGGSITRWSRTRFEAFRDGLPDTARVCELALESIELAAHLKAMPRPIAVFAACDLFARDIVGACQIVGLRIPEEIAILGCDNDRIYCEGIRPRISSLQPDFIRVGYRAAQTLEGLLQKRARKLPPIALVARAHIVERESAKPIHPAVLMVDRAGEFITKHACSGIGVMDVVRAVGVSRSLLDTRFRELRGESILEAIHTTQFSRLCELLRISPAPIAKVAHECGFANIDNLMRQFRKRYKCTMREFRRNAQAR